MLSALEGFHCINLGILRKVLCCGGGLGAGREEWVEASDKGTFGLALSRFCHLQPVVCSIHLLERRRDRKHINTEQEKNAGLLDN